MIKYILLGVLIALLIVVAVLIIVIVKKNNNNQYKHHNYYYNYGVDPDNGMYTKEGSGLISKQDLETVMSDNTRGALIQLYDSYHNIDYGRTFITGCKTIGSANGSADIKIPADRTVSGVHCKLIYRKKRLYICDMNSTNGTFVNGSMINNEICIDDHANIMIGNTRLRLDILQMF